MLCILLSFYSFIVTTLTCIVSTSWVISHHMEVYLLADQLREGGSLLLQVVNTAKYVSRLSQNVKAFVFT